MIAIALVFLMNFQFTLTLLASGRVVETSDDTALLLVVVHPQTVRNLSLGDRASVNFAPYAPNLSGRIGATIISIDQVPGDTLESSESSIVVQIDQDSSDPLSSQFPLPKALKADVTFAVDKQPILSWVTTNFPSSQSGR